MSRKIQPNLLSKYEYEKDYPFISDLSGGSIPVYILCPVEKRMPYHEPEILPSVVFKQKPSQAVIIEKRLMNWIPLTTEAQFEEILERSADKPQAIFKHSTRCGTSSMVLSRLERSVAPETIDFYFLDLIAHRNISNRISEALKVYHESPQILLIKKGECTYDESHMGISMDDLSEQAV